MTERAAWRLTKRGGARADAPGIFVPVDELASAQIGDRVLVESDDSAGTDRAGTIVETVDRDGRSYFRLDFESPR